MGQRSRAAPMPDFDRKSKLQSHREISGFGLVPAANAADNHPKILAILFFVCFFFFEGILVLWKSKHGVWRRNKG
jgi:hypothetical protein